MVRTILYQNALILNMFLQSVKKGNSRKGYLKFRYNGLNNDPISPH